MACPYIDVPDLPEGDRTCPICNDPYHPLSQRARDPDLKVAQRLPCRHLLCDRCLATWLSPLDARNNNTCPFDRRVLFPKFPPFPTAEGTQRRVDLVDWLNGARGRRPEGAERDGTGALKAALVERRLRDAVGELEVDGSAAHALGQWGPGAGEVDAAALSAYRQQLQRFEHRLTAVGAIAESVQGHVQISTLRTRLQCLTEGLARDRAKVQGVWDATNELVGGTGAEGSGRSR